MQNTGNITGIFRATIAKCCTAPFGDLAAMPVCGNSSAMTATSPDVTLTLEAGAAEVFTFTISECAPLSYAHWKGARTYMRTSVAKD